MASRDTDSGVTVTVNPADRNGQAGGTTQFTRVYSKGTEVSLSAKQSVGDNQLKQLWANGVSISTESTVTLTMDYDRTLLVVYMPKPASPKITKQPSSRMVTEGETAVLSVAATGAAPLSYR